MKLLPWSCTLVWILLAIMGSVISRYDGEKKVRPRYSTLVIATSLKFPINNKYHQSVHRIDDILA